MLYPLLVILQLAVEFFLVRIHTFNLFGFADQTWLKSITLAFLYKQSITILVQLSQEYLIFRKFIFSKIVALDKEIVRQAGISDISGALDKSIKICTVYLFRLRFSISST